MGCSHLVAMPKGEMEEPGVSLAKAQENHTHYLCRVPQHRKEPDGCTFSPPTMACRIQYLLDTCFLFSVTLGEAGALTRVGEV